MIGPHVIGSINHHQETIRRWRPQAALLLDPAPGAAALWRSWSPNTFLIGRVFRPDGEIAARIKHNPEEAGQWAAALVQSVANANREIDVWQFNNEVVLNSPEELALLSRFSIAYIDQLANHGLKAAIGGFSTGRPEAPELDGMAAWNAFLPAMRHGISRGAVLLLHAYGAPDIFRSHDWYLHRYESKVLPFLPEDVKLMPYVYGEYGCDMGVVQSGDRRGWKSGYGNDAQRYVADLVQAARRLANHSQCLGACLFTLGSNADWHDFDIEGDCARRLAEVSWPVPSPSVAPTPAPAPVPVISPPAQPVHNEPTPMPISNGGNNRMQAGINTDPRNPNNGRPNPAQLKDAGARWVRFVFKNDNDGELESDFHFYQGVIDELHGAGIKVLLVINNESCPGRPTWHQFNRDRQAWQRIEVWQSYLHKFADRCRIIAARFGGRIDAIQIWNEPDHPPRDDFDPTVDPRIYGPMLQLANQAIKSVSNTTVVTAGFVSGDPDWPGRVMAAAGGQMHADAIAVHPYAKRPRPEDPDSWGNTGVQYELLQQYQARYDKPIWVTELGTHSPDPTVRNNFPERSLSAIDEKLRGHVPVAFWFCWSNGMVNPHGIVESNGTANQSYVSFQRYAKQPMPVADVALAGVPHTLNAGNMVSSARTGGGWGGFPPAEARYATYAGYHGYGSGSSADEPNWADLLDGQAQSDRINQDDMNTFGIQIQRAQVEPGAHYWRLVEVRHTNPNTEFGGDQHVYIEALDESGNKLRDIPIQVVENGQRKQHTLDKGTHQPGADWPLWPGGHVSVAMLGAPSDSVGPFHTDYGPYKGGDLYHHSFYVVFQRARAGEMQDEQPDPVAEIRSRFWQASGVPQSWAEYVRRHNLGAPVTGREQVGPYLAQGFAQGIVYAPQQDEDAVEHVSW